MLCTLSDLDPTNCAHCRGEALDPSVPAQVDRHGAAVARIARTDLLPVLLPRPHSAGSHHVRCDACGRVVTKSERVVTTAGVLHCAECGL